MQEKEVDGYYDFSSASQCTSVHMVHITLVSDRKKRKEKERGQSILEKVHNDIKYGQIKTDSQTSIYTRATILWTLKKKFYRFNGSSYNRKERVNTRFRISNIPPLRFFSKWSPFSACSRGDFLFDLFTYLFFINNRKIYLI